MIQEDSKLLNNQELYQALNLETGKLEWEELQKHFARGVVIDVNPELDLVQVASALVRDDKSWVQSALENGAVCRATDEHGRQWADQQSSFWAIVVAPWVLVQEISVQ